MATKTSLRLLARHYLDLLKQTDQLKAQLTKLITGYAPELLAVHGVGPDTAARPLREPQRPGRRRGGPFRGLNDRVCNGGAIGRRVT